MHQCVETCNVIGRNRVKCLATQDSLLHYYLFVVVHVSQPFTVAQLDRAVCTWMGDRQGRTVRHESGSVRLCGLYCDQSSIYNGS